MTPPKPPHRIEHVPIAYIAPNPWQPRLQVRDEDLTDLVASIQRHDFSGSLEVRHDPNDPQAKLQLIFGHRRLRAAELAGLTTVPVKIVERSDREMVTLAYLENSTQLPLSYWDEAVYFGRLRDEFGISIRDLAADLNVSKGYVQNRLDLLKLPPDSPIRAAACEGAIELTAALTLKGLSRTLPQSQFEALLAQLRAGTLTGKELTQIKLETTTPAETAAPQADAERTVEDQEASAGAEARGGSGSGSEIYGVSGVGRFAELILTDETHATTPSPDPGGPRPFPCGADDEWLIETGQLHPDGTETVPADATMRASQELLRLLRRQVPRFEQLAAVATVEELASSDRLEFAKLVRRLRLVGETFQPDEQPMAS